MSDRYNPERPWERQPCDSPEGFAVLQEYIALPPPRTVRALGRGHPGFDRDRWERTAVACGWDVRARAWDDHIAALRMATVEAVTISMAERHAELGRSFQRVAKKDLKKLEAIVDREDGHPTMQPREIVRYAEAGTRIEREAAGLPTTPEARQADLSKLTLEELRTLRELTAKAER